MSIAAPMISSVRTGSAVRTKATGVDAAVHARLRITARGRKVLAVLVALPVVSALTAVALFGGGSAIATGGGASTEFDYITVTGGQSLWGIAETIAPEADPRDVIAEIMSLNQLTESSVQPGQRIAVPADLAG
jgi:hypothetical protein